MSYLLLREGEPPFVLTVENAPAYFEILTALRDVGKNSLASLFRLLGARKRLSALLRDSRTATTCWTRRLGASPSAPRIHSGARRRLEGSRSARPGVAGSPR
jgi:hypothetical protein